MWRQVINMNLIARILSSTEERDQDHMTPAVAHINVNVWSHASNTSSSSLSSITPAMPHKIPLCSFTKDLVRAGTRGSLCDLSKLGPYH